MNIPNIRLLRAPCRRWAGGTAGGHPTGGGRTEGLQRGKSRLKSPPAAGFWPLFAGFRPPSGGPSPPSGGQRPPKPLRPPAAWIWDAGRALRSGGLCEQLRGADGHGPECPGKLGAGHHQPALDLSAHGADERLTPLGADARRRGARCRPLERSRHKDRALTRNSHTTEKTGHSENSSSSSCSCS